MYRNEKSSNKFLRATKRESIMGKIVAEISSLRLFLTKFFIWNRLFWYFVTNKICINL